jgi:hypothetical protein
MPKRMNVFKAVRVNIDTYGVFRQLLYGIDQFICRCGVEVARQFQTKAVTVFMDAYSEI